MAYEFTSFTVKNISKTGTDLLSPLNFASNAIPLLQRFAIGNRVRLSIRFDRKSPDNFLNKVLRVNLGLFTTNNNGFAFQYGFQSDGFLTTTPAAGVFQLGNDAAAPTRENFTSVFYRVGNNEAYCDIDFYITHDLLGFINNTTTVSNLDRFLTNRSGFSFNQLQNNGASVYRAQSGIGVKAFVFDYNNFATQVINPATNANFIIIPTNARFYNSDYFGVTTSRRFMREITATSPFQISSGLPSLTAATASGPQATAAPVDPTFSVLRNQLSVGEKNTMRITLRGLAANVGNNPPVTNVRVLLIRTDGIDNTSRFDIDLSLSDAVIPVSQPGATQIDGAIWGPTSWVEDNPLTDDVQINFVIDGAYLANGGTYRVIVNVYDSANASYVTSHISPELVANFTAPAIPTITGALSTYNKEYSGNHLQYVAPHERIKGKLVIDKTSYNAALAALGLVGNFDTAIQEISAELLAIPTILDATIESYIPSTANNSQVLSTNFNIVQNDATTLIVEALFRIEEERANTSTQIFWRLKFNQPTAIPNQFEEYVILFPQLVDVRKFENNEASPKLLSIKFYDFDDYPAKKTEVRDICDRDFIVCEVEKDAALTGSINFIANIYPSDELGDTVNSSIEEEESWAPLTVQMPLLTSPKLDNVETGFGGNNFVSFTINLLQIPRNQRYFITAQALKQMPNYCPLGITDDILIETYKEATYPFWVAKANPTDFINSILAHPDYVSGLNVVTNSIIDQYGAEVGLNGNQYAGYIVTAFRIRQSMPKIWYKMQIDAVFNSGSGNHTVSHTLLAEMVQPPTDPAPTIYDTNTYICNDLG